MPVTFDDFDPIAVAGSSNRYKLAMCLWHTDTNPSMLIYHDGFFKCLGCGEQGGWGKLYKKMHEVAGTTPSKPLGGGRLLPRLPTTLRQQQTLANEAHEALTNAPALGWYVEQRRLKDQIRPLRLGWWDGWITIPVRDQGGDMQGLVMRADPNMQARYNMRFMTPPGQPALLYVPNWDLLNSEPVIFICFGMFDAPSISKLGFAAATTTAGKDSFRPEWLDAYRKPIYAIGDVGEDSAALRPGLTGGLDWRHRRLTLRYPEKVKDPNDFWMQHREKELYAQLEAVRAEVLADQQRFTRRLQRRRPGAKPVPAQPRLPLRSAGRA